MAPRSSSSNPTPGKLWRSRRNLVIAAAHLRLGFSQRFLADVFDLPPSSIGPIARAVEAEAEAVAEKLRASDLPRGRRRPSRRPGPALKSGRPAPRKG